MDKQSKKWQLTINNPQDKGIDHDAIKKALEQFKGRAYWCMADEVGLETKTPHTHIFLCLKSRVQFSTVKKRFGDAYHIEQALGTAQQNRSYVQKADKWANDPKADTSVPGTFEEWGELPEEPGQGYRSDFDEIAALLDDGKTPSEIMMSNFAYRRYRQMIREAYFDKRRVETPPDREVKIHYLVGDSGSGKTYTYVSLCEEYGEDNVYFLTDYDGGGFDNYQAEPILFMDEYKANFRYGQFLILTDKYKSQIHARYANIYALWTDVYITSIYPPEELYRRMVEENIRGIDTQIQLLRRITDITYCYKDTAGEYQRYTVPMSGYVDYEELKAAALEKSGAEAAENAEFTEEAADSGEMPF